MNVIVVLCHLCVTAPDPFVKSLRLHSDAVLCLASDDKFILSGSKDQTVALYDRRAGKLLQKVQVHTQTQCASSYLLSMSYSGGELWAGDNRGLVHTFSLHNGSLTPVSQFSIHSAMVTGIHYSSGTLYTCSSDRTVKVKLPSVKKVLISDSSLSAVHFFFYADSPPMCPTKNTVYTSPPVWGKRGMLRMSKL